MDLFKLSGGEVGEFVDGYVVGFFATGVFGVVVGNEVEVLFELVEPFGLFSEGVVDLVVGLFELGPFGGWVSGDEANDGEG